MAASASSRSVRPDIVLPLLGSFDALWIEARFTTLPAGRRVGERGAGLHPP
jgi:hypothetical protein